jgi:hypothetical protein
MPNPNSTGELEDQGQTPNTRLFGELRGLEIYSSKQIKTKTPDSLGKLVMINLLLRSRRRQPER